MPKTSNVKMTYFGLDLPTTDLEELRRMAAADGHRPVASVIRRIVREYLQARDDSGGSAQEPRQATIPLRRHVPPSRSAKAQHSPAIDKRRSTNASEMNEASL
jgi:hypothetical protein